MKRLSTLILLAVSFQTLAAGDLQFGTLVYFTAPDSNAAPGTALTSSGQTLGSFDFSTASPSHPIFTSGLYFPVTDCQSHNLWVRLRHIAADPNGVGNGQAITSTTGRPCYAGNNTVGGFAGFLYQIEVYRDQNFTGVRSNLLGSLYPTAITVASLETLCCPGGPYEWLSFEILNPESSGWNLNTINFTGSNPGSNPGFTRRPVYVNPTNNSFRPPEFVPQFPTGSDSVYAITLTTGGYSEFRMSANQVSKFRYGYEFFNWGYQGMSMAFGDPPAVADSVVNERCFRAGGSIYLSPAGLGPYTYSWSNGSTTQNLLNVPPGTYTATVTDINGCASTVSKTIAPGPLFTVALSQSLVDTATLLVPEIAGGEPPFTYRWRTGEETDSLLVNRNGTYRLAVTDGRNCTSEDSILVDRYVAIKPWLAGNGGKLKIWPILQQTTLKLNCLYLQII